MKSTWLLLTHCQPVVGIVTIVFVYLIFLYVIEVTFVTYFHLSVTLPHCTMYNSAGGIQMDRALSAKFFKFGMMVSR